MEQWEISKSLEQCYGTSRKIMYGEEYFAALVETENGLQRRDFSAEYWNTEKPQVFCYWKTKLPHPDQKKQVFVDDDMLVSFFERLANETDREKINFRFALMLILMRKRRLKYDSSRKDADVELWRLKVAGEDRFVEVINPHLDDEQIAALSSQLGQILQVDL